MASPTTIVMVLIASGALILSLSFWYEARTKTSSEAFLTDSAELLPIDEVDTQLDGPLTPEEQEITNPIITSTMNPTAVITTNRGVVELELFEDTMPITVANFAKLAESNFYDGIKFHRVISGFMIQGGDPNSRGADESIYGQGGPETNVQDEFVPGELLTNTRGTIAMANTGQPNSGGSQWFINLGDNTGLDFDKEPSASRHPVFGRVANGMDVVDIIGATETKGGDIPVDPVVIESIVIVRN